MSVVIVDHALHYWCAQVNTAEFVVMLDRQSPQELSPFIGRLFWVTVNHVMHLFW